MPQQPSEIVDELTRVKSELVSRQKESKTPRRPMPNIGDDALEDSVCEEYFNTTLKELENRRTQGGGSFFSRIFDFTGE